LCRRLALTGFAHDLTAKEEKNGLSVPLVLREMWDAAVGRDGWYIYLVLLSYGVMECTGLYHPLDDTPEKFGSK
jgi:hypothetical protein